MTNIQHVSQLDSFRIYKFITEYQIKWLSTSYEIPNLSYTLIIKQFPFINKDTAIALLNYWLQFETNQNISVYNKGRFNTDSNVETILKLQKLVQSLIQSINDIEEKENVTQENKDSDGKFPYAIKSTEDGGIEISTINKSWMKKNIVLSFSREDAVELKNKLITLGY